MRIFSKYALSAPVSAMPHRAAIFAMQKCDKIKTACDCSSPQSISPDGIFRRGLCFYTFVYYLFIHLIADSLEAVDDIFQLFLCMGSADLRADSRLALRHYGI